MGIVLEGSAKAYPLRSIVSPKVINDSLSGREMVVTFDPTSETGAIFDRTVDGRTLTFEPKADAGDGLLMIRDRETGSVWLGVNGTGYQRPHGGNCPEGDAFPSLLLVCLERFSPRHRIVRSRLPGRLKLSGNLTPRLELPNLPVL